tara:strand:- start:586 stop:1053 length:468 start_codon:yes stop_codon:yes gene_type:complete
MRLYIENIDINNLNIKNIKNYKKNTYKNNYIISNNSICTIKNDIIYKINQIDFPIISFKIKNYSILVDKSYWKKNKQLMHLSNKHIILSFLTDEYKINPLDQIKLIIEYKIDNLNNILYNLYFLIDEYNISNPQEMDFYNIEIIDTFLSLLRNVN